MAAVQRALTKLQGSTETECRQDRRQSRDEWRLVDARLAGELFFFDNDTLAQMTESPPDLGHTHFSDIETLISRLLA